MTQLLRWSMVGIAMFVSGPGARPAAHVPQPPPMVATPIVADRTGGERLSAIAERVATVHVAQVAARMSPPPPPPTPPRPTTTARRAPAPAPTLVPQSAGGCDAG